ncbi:DUF2303 family protein [Corynebacteriaceae bacterium 7-707]
MTADFTDAGRFFNEGPGSVSTIANLAKDTVDRSESIFPSFDDVDGILNATQTVYRIGGGAEKIKVSTHENLLPRPFRARGTSYVTSVSSFVEMTGRFGTQETIVFNDEEKRSLTAVLNYAHDVDDHDPRGWGDHRVEYTALHSPEWKKWAAADGRLMTQRDFAEMLQDLRHTIVDPTAADIVQIARTFTATRTANFESGVRLESGDVQFSYVQETRAKAGPSGGTVEVPEEIILSLPIFRDSDAPTEVVVEFRYDASERGLHLGYRIRQREELVDAAWAGLKTQAVDGVTVPVVDGPAPSVVTPME